MLPNELWSNIIELLCRKDQITCLSVSSLYHDISMRMVFSSVTLYFLLQCQDNSIAIDEGEIAHLSTMSWEILDYISENAVFANCVRQLSVVANTSGPIIFERHCLVKAIRALHNLLSFQWNGNVTFSSAEILEALPPLLRELKIPAAFPIPVHTTDHIHRLVDLSRTNEFYLRSNVLLHSSFNSSDEPTEQDASPTDTVRIAVENDTTLRKLTISEGVVQMLPVRSFNSLTHLTVNPTENLPGFELVLHHALYLVSLALFDLSDDSIVFRLQANAKALPGLTSLQISSDVFLLTDQAYRAIRDFLENKKILPVLQTVEVLALIIMPEDVDEALLVLTRRLSPNATALRLDIKQERSIAYWGGGGWIDELAQMPFLRFLDVRSSSLPPLDAHDLASDLTRLETVGVYGRVWSIDRPNGEEGELTLSEWSPIRLALAELQTNRHGDVDRDVEWVMGRNTNSLIWL
ncbi:hypothetical protein PLICRDRAFT_34560 [Plicaturopsis crispa FD-325 SS-3]|nr:hypothetical protein PLICRDRAFT_34560 [Plicaturopsis crispa FD-325 SS-3]